VRQAPRSPGPQLCGVRRPQNARKNGALTPPLRIIFNSAYSAVCGAPHKAEFERELILSRISEGRKRARRNGIKFGRKPKLTDYQRQEALERLAQGESQSTIARTFNVDRATISRLARAWGSE
jgi:hypothetical protein